MSQLFTDEVFHIGADEAFEKDAPCDVVSTTDLERSVVGAVSSGFGKTPAGWEGLFNSGAAR